jgi:hypothetical protein
MNRELLEKPFETDEIKQREGNFGKTLDYVEGHSIIQRLNDAFDAEWSFAILKHEIFKETDEVLVLAELKAGDFVKNQFGSSKITRVKDSGEIISLADDLKAAATDALKKTATMYGVALYLYRNGNGAKQDNKRTHEPEPPRGKVEIGFQPVDNNVYKPRFKGIDNAEPGKESEPNNGDKCRSGGNGKGAKQITQRQWEYITSMGKKVGLNIEKLSQKSIQMFNRELAYLTSKEASTFIDNVLHGSK